MAIEDSPILELTNVVFNPNISLDELRDTIKTETGTQISLSTIWHHLKHEGFTLKKVSHVHCLWSSFDVLVAFSFVSDHEMRYGTWRKTMAFFRHRISKFDPAQLVFVDESSFDRWVTYRTSVWGFQVQRVFHKLHFTCGWWWVQPILYPFVFALTIFTLSNTRYSVLPTLSLDGIFKCLVEGSFNTTLFHAFIIAVLKKMNP